MNTRSILLTITLIAFVVIGCSSQTNAPAASNDVQKFSSLQGNATKGRAAFMGTCAACHGQEGKGIPALGKDLTRSEFVKNLSDADFILFLTKGRPGTDPLNTTKVDMPPRGGNPALKDQDLADIVAFVRTLQK